MRSIEFTKGETDPPYPMVDPHILVVQGDDYIYTVRETSAWNAWCLLIQSEVIKYAEDKRSLYVVDADGQKCRLDIMGQEKR